MSDRVYVLDVQIRGPDDYDSSMAAHRTREGATEHAQAIAQDWEGNLGQEIVVIDASFEEGPVEDLCDDTRMTLIYTIRELEIQD
jgi:hypothetical protein